MVRHTDPRFVRGILQAQSTEFARVEIEHDSVAGRVVARERGKVRCGETQAVIHDADCRSPAAQCVVTVAQSATATTGKPLGCTSRIARS